MPDLNPHNLKHKNFLAILLIASAVLLLYSVSLGHNFLFDEDSIILFNRYIQHFKLFPEIFTHGYFAMEEKSDVVWNVYYRPLTSLSFAWDYHWWKLNPLGYNITNTLLHILVSALLFLLIQKAIKHDVAAFMATLLYSVHTLHTEAVTYIASRGDVLAAVFMLLAMHAYWRDKLKTALLCYGLALFSKESSLLLPLYLIALDLSVIRSSWLSLAKKMAPYIVLAIIFSVFRKN